MNRQRQTGIDLLKALAAQMVVLHHLCVYGTLAEAMGMLAPRLAAFLFDYGRVAVQVFLVLGGFLAVQTLSASARQAPLSWRRLLWQRYMRLVPAFLVAMALALLAGYGVSPWLQSDWIGEPRVDRFQWLSHALLLQSVFNVPSLSVGVWYVSIDFQLFLVLAAWLRWTVHRPGLMRTGVVGATACALFVWNLRPELDDWWLYFFGSYGLGVMAHWACAARTSAQRHAWGVGMAMLAGLAWLWDPRIRLAVAAAIALWLVWTQHHRRIRWPKRLQHWVHRGGQTSYALFLAHFPVLVLANGWVTARPPAWPGPWPALLAGTWLACLLAGWAFERWVERPLGQLAKRWTSRPHPPV